MKRFAYYIACCTLVALCACTHDDTDDVIPVGNGKITIQASLDDMAITRATVGDTQAERKIRHIDVFAVDENDDIAYYERNTMGNNNGANEDGSGVLTLNVARRAKINDTFVFAQGKEYKFYLVANATATETEMGAINTLAALQQLVQDDSFIPNTDWASGEQTLLHLTGTTDLGTNPDKKAPETFLMDAVATDAQSNNAWVVNPTDGNLTNLNLSAEFKRAAAKIIVNITQGEDVEFHTKMEDETSQYDFIELPASTFVLPSDEPLVGIKLVNTNPMEPNDQTFVWTSEDADATNYSSIKVVGYTYAHFWDNANLKNETSLILNIPMMWNQDDSEDKSKEAEAPRSWYKVPLSKDKKFERNKCYVVNVTINAVGAANRSTAIELDDIEYKTLDWVDVDINVGDDENRPAYLELNTDLVEIYNMNFDYTQLEFSSSSYIPNNFANENSSDEDIEYIKNNGGIILTDAYYYNYLDQKVELSTTAGDKYKIYANIKSTAEQDVLNGKINIDSPFVGISEQELYEKFGAAPVVPAMPTEPVNPVPAEAVNPGTQSEYAAAMSESAPENPKNNDKYYTYSWYYGRFYRITWTYNSKREKWNEGNWSEDWNMLNAYNNAIAAWETWDAWNSLPQPEKDAAIAQYNDEVATYSERLTYYNQQVAAKEKYDEDVAAYTAGKVDSHSNAIRYLVFEVYNETGQKATFTVAQYPTLYITNEMGYYSYRSDFGGTTYEKKGNPNYAGATRNDDTGGWTYTRVASNSNMFGSKVAVKDANSNTYSINYYYWSENGNTRNSDGKISSLNNPRMYHVHVTATSSKYTVGKPRLGADGFTEATEENSKLVSPSFMIASQLGASRQVGNSTFAAKHCKEYVEVTTDGTIYDDWRLPTEAEVMIIIEHQYKSDAMAEVLSGKYYYCAWTADGNNYVYNEQSDTEENTKAIRCIRDAY